MTEHIVAVSESESEAQEAEHDLEAHGLESSAMRRYKLPPRTETEREATGDTKTGSSGGGFWAWLLGEEDSETTRSAYETDAQVYEHRAQAGNTVLSVTVADDSRIHEVVDVLEAHHPREMDETTDENAGTGAKVGTDATVGTRTAAGPGAAAGTGTAFGTEARTAKPGVPGAGRVSTGRAPDTMAPGMRAGAAGSVPAEAGTTAERAASAGVRDAAVSPTRAGQEEVIPLAEENLEIGKRMVDRGTTRVRRYVVETPVERDVTLQGERVTVERRRPVDASSAPDARAFEERTVEVHETEEEPEIRKSARVVEEVVVRREETERKEKVRDTVRRDEVDISPQARAADRPRR